MCLHWLERRQLNRRACFYIEPRTMARTFDLITLQLALVERAPIVCAHVVDRIKLPVHIAHRHFVIANLKDGDALGRNVGCAGDGLPGGSHAADSPSAMAVQTASSTEGNWSFLSVDWKNPSTIRLSAVARSNPRLCK